VPLDAETRAFLDAVNARPQPAPGEIPIDEFRLAMRAFEPYAFDGIDLPEVRDVLLRPPDAEPVRARIYRPDVRRPAPIVVWAHGGSWVRCDLETHDRFFRFLAHHSRCIVLAVDYRLAPEHPFPAGIEDSIAAARWAAESPEALGRQVTGLVTCGDSAGGNFAIVVAMALRDEPAAVPVLAQWPIYPAADPVPDYPSKAEFGQGHLLTDEGMNWFDECYKGVEDDWRYSPLAASQAGMPPTLVLTASLDPIRDQGRAYAAACVQAGVTTVYQEAKGTIHGFINLRKAVPSADDDILRAVEALKLLIEEAKAG